MEYPGRTILLIDARRRRLVPAFIPDRLDQGAVVELDG